MAKSRSNSRRSQRRNAQRRRPSNLIPIKKAAMLGLPAILLAGAGYLAIDYMSTEKIDDAFCFARADQPEQASFVDASLSGQSTQQLRDYKRTLIAAYDQAAPNTRLMVFTTGNHVHGSVAKPVAIQCKPAATPEELVALRAPKQSAAVLANQAEEARNQFIKTIDQVMSDLQDGAKIAGDSPILETLQSISRYPGFQGRYRSLSIITDGVQNSELARFCVVKNDLPAFSVFETQRRYQFVAPDDLSGVRASLNIVETGTLPHEGMPFCSWPEIYDFFTDYLNANGASHVQIQRLRYGAG